ncbi:hypothetical protein [Sphingomonas sp.]|uniref:hypothetical protein n=1 Tax=Sphingomonas sp. TaxID=28214 RepID=UPI0031D815BC
MRPLLRLVLIFTLIWCGLHIPEPAQAHGGPVAEHALLDPAGDEGEDRQQPGEPAHASHHHCPVAPDQALRDGGNAWANGAAPIFAPRVAALRSHAQAPPLQPPST